jgi:uncharacterized caspase-like protein
LRLLLDGRPYQGDQGLKAVRSARLGEVRETWTVELPPGTHQLGVIAYNKVSQSPPAEVSVTYTAGGDAGPAQGNLYVLAVGINAYKGRNRLDCAVPDAKSISEALAKQQGKGLYRKVQTKLLTDQQASRKDILAGLAWLKQNMKGNDLAVFFYAGHGAKDKKTGKFYFLPLDLDPADLPKTAVSEDEVKAVLAQIPGKVLLLLDACHSGKIGVAGGWSGKRPADDMQRDLASDDYGVVVICAAKEHEESEERAELGHGLFTTAILEALAGKAEHRGGVVRLFGLASYVSDRVRELSQEEQTAVCAITTRTGSFPLAKP